MLVSGSRGRPTSAPAGSWRVPHVVLRASGGTPSARGFGSIGSPADAAADASLNARRGLRHDRSRIQSAWPRGHAGNLATAPRCLPRESGGCGSDMTGRDNEGRPERRASKRDGRARELLGQHVDGCAPCSALLVFAAARLDAAALRAWGAQLVEHLATDLARRRLGAVRDAGAACACAHSTASRRAVARTPLSFQSRRDDRGRETARNLIPGSPDEQPGASDAPARGGDR